MRFDFLIFTQHANMGKSSPRVRTKASHHYPGPLQNLALCVVSTVQCICSPLTVHALVYMVSSLKISLGGVLLRDKGNHIAELVSPVGFKLRRSPCETRVTAVIFNSARGSLVSIDGEYFDKPRRQDICGLRLLRGF